jgi:hypothetical protein
VSIGGSGSRGAILRDCFPYLPHLPGCYKRLRPPLPLVKQMIRDYLICTPAGMPILWALAGPKIGERQILATMLDVEPHLAADRPGRALITDKGSAARQTEADLATGTSRCCGLPAKTRPPAHGELLRKPSGTSSNRSTTPSKASSTWKPTGSRMAIRISQRILAMTAAICHNKKTGAPLTCSLFAHDH